MVIVTKGSRHETFRRTRVVRDYKVDGIFDGLPRLCILCVLDTSFFPLDDDRMEKA
jgi:hypothetical protein